MKTEVMNLATGEKQTFSCSAEQAVVCAYAQALGDYNTWDYHLKYDVKFGKRTVFCGDWSALSSSYLNQQDQSSADVMVVTHPEARLEGATGIFYEVDRLYFTDDPHEAERLFRSEYETRNGHLSVTRRSVTPVRLEK